MAELSSLLARRAKHLTSTAKVPHPWEYLHDEVGYNYRLPNLNAALGCAQLESLPQLLRAKRELFKRYQKVFAPIAGVTLQAEPDGCTSNYWLQTLVLEHQLSGWRDKLLTATNEMGIATRPVWQLIHKLTPYGNCPCMDLSDAEMLSQCVINIPSSSNLVSAPN